jgi:alpha-tubulin suppressor-like RCC1 family protein
LLKRPPSRWASWPVVAFAFIAFCVLSCTEFTSSTEISVILSTADWPAQLAVTEIDTLQIAVLGEDGEPVRLTDVEAEWISSDGTVVEVAALEPPDSVASPDGGYRRATALDTTAARLRAHVTARRSGSAEVKATVSRRGLFQATETTNPITVVGVGLTPAPDWPDSLAVTDTVRLVVHAGGAEGTSLAGLRVRWESSDESVLAISSPAADTLSDSSGVASTRATALASGTVELTVTVDKPGFESLVMSDSLTVTQRWIQVSAGSGLSNGRGHTCALTAKLKAHCWGANGSGQLGIGNVGDGFVPLAVFAPGVEFEHISAGSDHTCAIVRIVTYCWGSNSHGQLASETLFDRFTPREVEAQFPFTFVSAGDSFTCGISTDGPELVKCWGWGSYAQLGRLPEVPPFDDCWPLENIVKGQDCLFQVDNRVSHRSTFGQINSKVFMEGIDTGSGLACGLESQTQNQFTASRPTFCWGRGSLGELGLRLGGTSPGGRWDTCQVTPNSNSENCSQWARTVDSPDGAEFVQVSAGLHHVCAVATDGAAYCWGRNDFGQGGAPSDTVCTGVSFAPACNLRPVAVATTLRFTSISAGFRFTCGLTPEREIYCWGDNEFGQLGSGNSGGMSDVPLKVVAPQGVRFGSLSAGGKHSCAISDPNGAIYCWGYGANGRLGNGSTANSPTAVRTSEPTE